MTAPLTPVRLPSNGRVYAVAAAVVLVLLGAAYCAGTSHGARDTTVAAIQVQRDTVIDTIRVVEQRLVHDTVRVRATAAVSTAKRAMFDSAAHAVEAVADTSATVPTNLAMPAVHACEAALTADSIAYHALAANLVDMTADRDAQRQRAEDDERELKVLKPSRFGFRSGLVAGIATVAAMVHFVR